MRAPPSFYTPPTRFNLGLVPADFDSDGRLDFASVDTVTSNTVVRIFRGSLSPLLELTSDVSGNFVQGQGATFTVTASNVGGAVTNGTVTVTQFGTLDVSVQSMSGTGWSCSGNSCTRSDVLTAGLSYPPITVSVNVGMTALTQETGFGTATGGGSMSAEAIATFNIVAPNCSFSLGATSASATAAGGPASVNVIAPAGCAWNAGSNAPWLTITSGSSGVGNGMVNYTVGVNAAAFRSGTLTIAGLTFTVNQAGTAAKVGAYNAGYWALDKNGSLAWDGTSVDQLTFWSLGQPGEIPVYGDWNGDGRTKIGLYVNGTWLLDYNGNGVWDGPDVDKLVYFGGPGYAPLVGDWNGSGTSKIAVHQNGTWLIDYDGNFQWDGPGVDKLIFFGGPGYTPVLGDWNGSGTTKIGVHQNGTWLIDFNGNFQWDGPGTDKLIFFGGPGYTPVVGDWNGSGTTKIGAYLNGLWLLDYNGNFQWDGTATDKLIFFGGPGYTPMVGDWNGSGTTKIAAYLDGQWVIDVNGNFTWDPPTDQVIFFGGPGQTPVVGKW